MLCKKSDLDEFSSSSITVGHVRSLKTMKRNLQFFMGKGVGHLENTQVEVKK